MEKIMVGCIPLGMLQTNCYFLHRENNPHVIMIDPGDEGEKLYLKFLGKGLTIDAILLTHGHFDHIGGVTKLKELSEAKVYVLDKESILLQDTSLNGSKRMRAPVTVIPDVLLKDRQQITIADICFEVIATPGHTGGSSCYYVEENKSLFGGDTLFEESVGRTDLPTGSVKDLRESVENRLFSLPDDVTVYPGHGNFTQIGHEKKYNPFF